MGNCTRRMVGRTASAYTDVETPCRNNARERRLGLVCAGNAERRTTRARGLRRRLTVC
jgi:hypothetical protein